MKHNNKYYKYFQPNDKDLKDKVGDCQIRALSKALNLTWVQAFDLTIPICRELQTYTFFDSDFNKTKEAMKSLGFEYTGISNKKGSKRPTVQEFAKNHPEGTYVLSLANHVVACVDGIYYDTWNCGYKSLYGYYTLIRPVLYEMYHTAYGWQIRTRDTRYKRDRWLYVGKVHRDGTYTFYSDYLYAKNFSKQTALKHLTMLNENQIKPKSLGGKK